MVTVETVAERMVEEMEEEILEAFRELSYLRGASRSQSIWVNPK